MTLPPRFWAKVVKTDTCWLWVGGKNHYGYGSYRVNGFAAQAHRVAYEALRGRILDGMTLDHLCRNRDCVNPAHLEPVSLAENILRGESPPAQNARKEACPYGHPYDEANTYITKRGCRQCRKCNARRQREFQRRQREPVVA